MRVNTTHHVYHTNMGNAVDVDISTVTQFLQIKRSTIAHTIFTSQVVDESGVNSFGYLRMCLCQGSGREAHKMFTVGTNFYHCQFKEVIVEGILKHGKVISIAINNGACKSQGSHTTVAQTHNIHCAARSRSNGILSSPITDNRGSRICQVAGAKYQCASSSPALNATVVEFHSSATFSTHSSAERSFFKVRSIHGRNRLRVNSCIHPIVPVGVVGAVHHYTRGRVSPTAEVTVMHPLTHSNRAIAIEHMLPPTAGRNAKRVAVLNKINVSHVTVFHITETRVGSSYVFHNRAQHHAVVGKTVAPSQSRIHPVHYKHQLVVAFSNPVKNIACADSGIRRHRLANGIYCLRINSCIHPVVPVGVVGAVHHHTSGRVSPTAEVTVVQLLAQSI